MSDVLIQLIGPDGRRITRIRRQVLEVHYIDGFTRSDSGELEPVYNDHVEEWGENVYDDGDDRFLQEGEDTGFEITQLTENMASPDDFDEDGAYVKSSDTDE